MHNKITSTSYGATHLLMLSPLLPSAASNSSIPLWIHFLQRFLAASGDFSLSSFVFLLFLCNIRVATHANVSTTSWSCTVAIATPAARPVAFVYSHSKGVSCLFCYFSTGSLFSNHCFILAFLFLRLFYFGNSVHLIAAWQRWQR